MKKLLSTLFIALFCASIYGQLNMQLLSKVSYNDDLNDVWGWVDEDTGTEYAIVGTRTGVSIVSLEDPSNAREIEYISGPRSTWRDIKTWGDFAYVTNETSDGVLVIDLSDVPNSISSYRWEPVENAIGGQLSSVHNLYIDEFGICYLAGANLNSGGVIYVDVHTTPGQPEIIGWGPAIYSHDVYARDNILYSSEIYEGVFTAYDVTDPQNPIALGSHGTPFSFTHNTWLSDDSNTLFTTDERENAPVAAYDVSDLSNINYLDEFRPIQTLGENVIPHNVHVWNDWLIISYYTDGGIVVDASRPGNLIEVGNFDSFFSPGAGFNGAWGAYPFLPSQTVLISDINSGLYVLQPNYVRACWLEGTVTEKGTGNLLNGVDVHIDSPQPNKAATDFTGTYASGQAIPGEFDIVFSKSGYVTKTVKATLENGVVTILDVELEPAVPFTFVGKIVDDETGNAIPDALVEIVGGNNSLQTLTDINGNFSVNSFFEDDYQIFAGKWGYQYAEKSQTINSSTNFELRLKKGYQDHFIFDYQWITDADANTSSGFWEREVPIGTDLGGGQLSNPGSDAEGDYGDIAYVTDNGGGQAGSFDVDGGNVYLTSPAMDLSEFDDASLTFDYWFINSGGNSAPNDEFKVEVSNGFETVEIFKTTESVSEWLHSDTFHLQDYLSLTDQVTIKYTTGDQAQTGHLVEAGVDVFNVVGSKIVDTEDLENISEINIFPNPFKESLNIEVLYFGEGTLVISNALGQRIEQVNLRDDQIISLGAEWLSGVYFASFLKEDREVESFRFVKQ
jgi:choice-of-anchor B domain-containing protein